MAAPTEAFIRPPIWELPRRHGMLVAGEREFRGSRFFELRLWTDDGKPTRKGITMPPEAVEGLARALLAYVEPCGSTVAPEPVPTGK